MAEARKASAGARATGAAAAIAAAIAIVLPFTEVREGTKLSPYRDIGGKLTVCTGETRVKMRRYTPAECRTMLERALREDYAPPVLACVPQLADNRYALAAAIDAAYNAGPRRVCASPMAARFRARDWHGGCSAYRGWIETAGGKWYRGLANRRNAEAELCRAGLAA